MHFYCTTNHRKKIYGSNAPLTLRATGERFGKNAPNGYERIMPSAAEITVQETLGLLDGPFAAMAVGVAEDRYAFWLGSGISFGRVAGLRRIIPKTLEFLRSQVVSGAANCRFRAALNNALSLASLSPEEWARVDFMRPFSEWADANSIIGRLQNNYARLLDVPVDGEPSDYLLWNGVDVRSTYADPAIEPDVEHLCLAILILEGTASDLATANWDGLIENAATSLTGGHPPIVVCVRRENLQEPNQRAHLFKFHGCAVLAVQNEALYRQYLIARQPQINSWATRPEHAALVARLIGIIVSKPTIMIGLSAQDANIQALFSAAQAASAWGWPGDRPSFVFSGNQVGHDQHGLLQNVYREAYGPATREDILETALLRAYAKQLLVALVLYVLSTKLGRLADLAPGALDGASRDHLRAGIKTVRDQIAGLASGDLLAFIRALVEHESRILQIFRDGQQAPAPQRYNPLTTTPIQQFAGDAALPSSGLRELAVAVGLLGIGVSDGLWELSTVTSGSAASGALQVSSAASTAKVFFLSNSHAGLRLRHNGHLAYSDDAIVIYSSEIAPALPRSPVSAPGRTGKLGLREVSIAELLAEAASSGELMQNFRVRVAV